MLDADTAYMTSRGLRTPRCPAAPVSRKQPQNRRMAGEPSSGRARVNHPALPGKAKSCVLETRLTGSSGLFSLCSIKADRGRIISLFWITSLFSMAYLGSVTNR